MDKFCRFLIMEIIFKKPHTFAPINKNKHARILYIRYENPCKQKWQQACSVNFLFDLVTADCSTVTGKVLYTYVNAAMQKCYRNIINHYKIDQIRINAPVLTSLVREGEHFIYKVYPVFYMRARYI